VKVPAGSATLVQAAIGSTTPDALNALQWHTVKQGESLASIAKKLRVSRLDLAEANYAKPNARVQVGQRLVIPRMPSSALLARAATTASADDDAAAAVAESEEPEDEPTRVTYRVRRGDTLSSIARKHGTTIDQLKAWNKLRGSTIPVGARLVIFSERVANQQ
jgi:membrane-bound lytic murein transglycosylase D